MSVFSTHQGLSARSLAVTQRFEAKYFLTEVEAALVRDYVISYTQSDRSHPEYMVSSIYLDTPDNQFFRSSDHGERNRFKLRVRGYETDATKPLFVEVKQRIGRIVRKHRSTVRRDCLGSLHWSSPPTEASLGTPNDRYESKNLLFFSQLAQSYRVEPRICVGYRRAAYVSIFDEPVRITFDDRISFAPVPQEPADLWSRPVRWSLVDDLPVVLEIKYTDSYPFWIRRMIQRFELRRTSLAKYVACLSTMTSEHGATATQRLH